MIKLKGYYDGEEFTKYCVINSVKPLLSGARENMFFTNKNISGASFYSSRIKPITLQVDITIARNVTYNLDRLNAILYSQELKKLTFSDRDDRYLMAIPDGEVKFTSNHSVGRATITFISSDYYWRATEGYVPTKFTGSLVTVQNKGTAPTKPIFDVDFKSDCGFLNIVAPQGFLALGNPTQPDNIELPSTEIAMDEKFASGAISSWSRLTNASTYIPDYVKMSSQGTASSNNDGLILNTSSVGTGEQWLGHAYIKSLTAGEVDQTADNFELNAKIDIANMSGTNNTCAMLIVVMDADNNPIMTTSVYDILNGKNELTVTYKIPENENRKRSRIIKTGTLNALNGYISMKKRGSRFEWEVYTDRTARTVGSTLRVGQEAHIKRTCTHAETGHPIKSGYHDLTYTIGAIKTGQDGTKAYRMDNGGWPIYWIYERDIQEMAQTVVERTPQTIKHAITDTQMAQMKASKVFIWQAKWSSTPVYSQFAIDSIQVKRTYDVTQREVKNVFTAGDHLYINNESGEVLLNGSNATGLLDVDSRFFEIGGGSTQLEITYSDWARMPDVQVSHESRWLS